MAAAIKDYRVLAQRLTRSDPAYFRDQQRDYKQLVELHQQVGAFLKAAQEAMQETRDEAAAEAVQEEARL